VHRTWSEELKSKIYIETSITSYLTARLRSDVRVLANQQTTLEWWESRSDAFALFISEFVLAELGLGDADAAQRRMEAIAGVAELDATDAVRSLGKVLILEGAIPSKAEIDAYHIAISAVHGLEYLLTWICTHIANAVMRSKIELVCRDQGY
jgi:hypothetical protein